MSEQNLQLDFFTTTTEEPTEQNQLVGSLLQAPSAAIAHLDEPISLHAGESLYPSITNVVHEVYEIGDTVKILRPTEEEDYETFNYLDYYFPHLLKPKIKGTIIQILPYQPTQYEVEFNCKEHDNRIQIYHKYLQWLG